MTSLAEDIRDGLSIRDNLPAAVEPMPEGEARFARFAEAVRAHTALVLAYDNQDGCLICDVQTANLIVQVADALKPANRASFLAMDLGRAVNIAWSLVK